MGVAVVIATGLLLLALVPLGFVRGIAEQRLSARFGAAVQIAAVERLDYLSLHPRLRIAGVRIGQPDWAGPGDLARVEEAVVRLPLLSALRGTLRPQSIDIRGLTLNLVRDANGKENWKAPEAGAKSEPLRISHLVLGNGRVTLKDAKRHMTLDAALSADAAQGLRIWGSGTHRGQPMRVLASGARLDKRDPNKPYPFRFALRSPLLVFNASGRMDHPLDLEGFSASIAAQGRDLVYLDDIIEAGLPGTQPFALKARVRRTNPDWNILSIAGTIGRSDLTGAAMVRKRNGRTNVEGHLDAGRLDFDDLASSSGLARRVAKRRLVGPRVIPDTDIHLEKLGRLDGTLRISARQLLLSNPSLFRAFRGTLTLDRRRLTLTPLVIQLKRGTLSGSMAVDHRAGQPKLTLDLRQQGTQFADLTGDPGAIDGPVQGRILLTGHGRDIRSALARASGRIGLAMRGGDMRRKLAIFASGDVLKSLGQIIGGSDSARVPVNCLIAEFNVRSGRMTPSALLVDTPVARADGAGGASLADESLAFLFSGRSKHPDPVQLAGKVRVGGTFSSPTVNIMNAQGQVPAKRGLIGKIGNFLGSLRTKHDAGRAPPVPAANCPVLAQQALR